MTDDVGRRDILKATLLAALLPATGSLAAKERKMKKCARMVEGMTVALVAPAGNAYEDEDARYAIDVLKSFGFKVRPGKHLYQRAGYLAGTDQQRAEDVNWAFADKEVEAIVCLRGGYGCLRILPLLDYDTIAANPKIIIGCSDITALVNAIHARTGMITFHGPVAWQGYSTYSVAEYRKVLFEGRANVLLGAPPPLEQHGPGMVERKNRLTRIVGGSAEGQLIGGNLSLMARLCGTPFEPDYRGRILVLEDVGEAPYRVDGMLAQLWLAGRLQQLAGVVIGKFTEGDLCGTTWHSFTYEEVLRHRFEALGIPCLRGIMVGHISEQTVIPVGCRARLDADAGTLTLMENAVI